MLAAVAAVGHVGGVEGQGVVEEGGAPLVDGLHLGDHLGEEGGVPGVDLAAGLAGDRVGVLDPRGVPLVLQGVAMPLVADGDDAGERRLVAAGGQGGHSRGVGLEGQDDQVGHQGDVLAVPLGVALDGLGDLPDRQPLGREVASGITIREGPGLAASSAS